MENRSWFDKSSRNSYINSMKTIVSEKGQVTIPKALREKLGLVPGTVLQLDEAGGKLIGCKEVDRDPIRKWRGRGRLPSGMQTDEYLRKARGDYSR